LTLGINCSYYIAYKPLKKRIRVYSARVQNSAALRDEEHQEIVKAFSELLDSQVYCTKYYFDFFYYKHVQDYGFVFNIYIDHVF
jgi:hypothetical protein